MNTYYFVGPKLVGTKWEDLTFDEYYIMSDEERQEIKEYLESINAPSGYELMMEEGEEILPGVCYLSWKNIVSMSDDSLEFYKAYRDVRYPPIHEGERDNTKDSEKSNYDDLPF